MTEYVVLAEAEDGTLVEVGKFDSVRPVVAVQQYLDQIGQAKLLEPRSFRVVPARSFTKIEMTVEAEPRIRFKQSHARTPAAVDAASAG